MLIDRKLKELREKDFKLLSQRYGFFDNPKTLEIIGMEMGITRERVRQKQSKAINRLKEMLIDNQEVELTLNLIIEASRDNVPLFEMRGFSFNYKDDSIVKIWIDVFLKDSVKIFSNQYLKSQILIFKKEEAGVIDNIIKIKNILEAQKEYVLIEDISIFLNCSKNLIKEYRSLSFKGDKVALSGNKNIFFDKLRFLENIFEENPYKIFNRNDLLKNMNININQLRGLIDRSEKIVCLEKSKYAYSENYKGGSSGRLVYYFLSKACQPMSFKNLLSLIKKERPFIQKGSVRAAIKLCDKIDEIDNNLFALTQWGYESKKEKIVFKKYKYRLKDVLINIFKSHKDEFFSIRDLKNFLLEKYKDSVSSDEGSIYLNLEKLNKEDLVYKIKKDKAVYYKNMSEKL